MNSSLKGAIALAVASLLIGASPVLAAATLTLTASPSDVSVGVTSLLPETGGVADDNAAVAAAVAGVTPVSGHLTNTGDASSSAVRINPVGAGAHIQLWTLAPDNNWYDINVIGYGEATGAELPAGFDSSVPFYAVSDEKGSYPLTIVVADVSDPGTPLSSSSVTVHADATVPTIALTGDATTTVFTSDTFTDPGAIATDDVDGSFAATASGSVDVSTPGIYVITYTATDAAGNSATPVTRTVEVKAAPDNHVSSRSGSSAPPFSGSGEVLGAFGFDFSNLSPAERAAQIALVKSSLAGLLGQLISLLQSQLAAAIAAGN